MCRLVEEREVVVYCDLHGHSRKQNVFIYGCDNMTDPYTRLHARIFPKMLAKNAPGKFSFKGSKFTVHKSKVMYIVMPVYSGCHGDDISWLIFK